MNASCYIEIIDYPIGITTVKFNYLALANALQYNSLNEIGDKRETRVHLLYVIIDYDHACNCILMLTN